MERYVTDLEHSMKLEKLGVKQESTFYVDSEGKYYFYNNETFIDLFDDSLFDWDYVKRNEMEIYSAFLVGELGEMLPDEYFSGKYDLKYVCSRIIAFAPGLVDNWDFDNPIYDLTEANARAKMLIYLIENKLMEV